MGKGDGFYIVSSREVSFLNEKVKSINRLPMMRNGQRAQRASYFYSLSLLVTVRDPSELSLEYEVPKYL